MPALERVNDIKNTLVLENAVLSVVPPTKTKVSATLNFYEPINSEYKEWFELKSVRRVNKVEVLSNLSRKKKPYVQDELLE